MNRREFLKISGVGTFFALAGGYEAGAKSLKEGNERMNGENTAIQFPIEQKIDFHCHAILPAYVRGMEKLGIESAAEEGYPLPKWTLDEHLKFMSEARTFTAAIIHTFCPRFC